MLLVRKGPTDRAVSAFSIASAVATSPVCGVKTCVITGRFRGWCRLGRVQLAVFAPGRARRPPRISIW